MVPKESGFNQSRGRNSANPFVRTSKKLSGQVDRPRLSAGQVAKK